MTFGALAFRWPPDTTRQQRIRDLDAVRDALLDQQQRRDDRWQ